MASLGFEFSNTTNGGANEQSITTLTATAGDVVRVRFEERGGPIGLFLHITGNGKETKEPIDGSTSWVSGALLTGDIVKLSCQLNGNQFSSAKGILEVGQ